MITKDSKFALEAARTQRRRDQDAELLETLRQFTLELGYVPSYLELAGRIGWSVNKVYRVLHRLEAFGLVKLGGGARTLRIVS